MVEYDVERICEVLIADLHAKKSEADLKISKEFETIYACLDVISSEISSDLQSTDNFNDVVSLRISDLNFFQHDIYNNYKKMFMTYGGKDFCYDPYYNMKNTVHPSFQVHPFLWNAVLKTNMMSLV